MFQPLLIGSRAATHGLSVLLVIGTTIAVVAAGCDAESRAIITGDADDVTVRVTGDAGEFSGSLGAGGSQRSVDGTTPATFTIEGDESSGIFVAVLQKRGEPGTLTVTLDGCPDGDIATQSTTAAFGVVTVSC